MPWMVFLPLCITYLKKKRDATRPGRPERSGDKKEKKDGVRGRAEAGVSGAPRMNVRSSQMNVASCLAGGSAYFCDYSLWGECALPSLRHGMIWLITPSTTGMVSQVMCEWLGSLRGYNGERGRSRSLGHMIEEKRNKP